jgi:Fur family ferric uptake transcriptional regulator
MTSTHPIPNGSAALVDAALAAAGLRRTRATVAVATWLASRAGQALRHADVEAGLAGEAASPNRVTLYRLLDRFAAAGILARSVDGQRHTRFAWVFGSDGPQPHFECDDCHRQLAVDSNGAAQAAAQELLRALQAAGHHATSVDLAVHGRCADCAAPASRA